MHKVREEPPWPARPTQQASHVFATITPEAPASSVGALMSTSWPDPGSASRVVRHEDVDTTTVVHSRSGGGASRALHFAHELDNKIIRRTLCSRGCLWQVRARARAREY